MSFGKEEDEFFTIDLTELLLHKESIIESEYAQDILPVLTNYDFQSELVLRFSIIPFTFETKVTTVYDAMEPNDNMLYEHLEIDFQSVSGYEQLAFTSSDYKILKRILTPSQK
jgi:hypothetical protein